MEEYEINEIEQEVLKLAKKDCVPAESKFEELRSRLIFPSEKQQSIKARKNRLRIAVASIAASFILSFGIGLAVYFAVYNGTLPNGNYTYEENDISIYSCTADDLMGVYLPDISILSNPQFSVGKHIATHEPVFYKIFGEYAVENAYCNIEMLLIVQPKYSPENEFDYETGDTLKIADKAIFHNRTILNDSLDLFKLGFQIDGTRYHVDLTSQRNDVHGELGGWDDIPETDYLMLLLQDFIK